MRIFDLTPLHALGRDIAHAAGYPLAALEARDFEGGQHKMRPLVSVRGEATMGQKVFIRDGVIEGPAPSLTTVLIEI